ncbi:MAG: IS1595 family transposase [Dehalococcoidia bacterium]
MITKQPKTLIEAIRFFSDPDTCLNYMVGVRWPNGIACPTCGSVEVSFLATRRIWKCKAKHVKQQFSVKVGTIFEDSPIGLDKWLTTMWLIANAKNGISSYEVHRAIGVTQKTAWFMLHRIRLAMQPDDGDKMTGTVEADETFIGGKRMFMHLDRRERVFKGMTTGSAGKTVVFGLLERHGPDGHSRVRTKVVKGTRHGDLIPEIRKNVEQGSELFTDTHPTYHRVEGYAHDFINHAEEYVRGKVHTNGMENFWSLLKRAIKGTYVAVEPFHLFRYLDEQALRFNTRKASDADRFERVSSSVVGKRIMYKDLIGATTTPA